MKFNKIQINNFRQYFGENTLELLTTPNANIVLIGGMNGYGKTNLLLAIVWCLYGEKLSQVDENFKNEIRKEKTYSAFMKQSLNWQALDSGSSQFSVTIHISELVLPQFEVSEHVTTDIIITRSFDSEHLSDNLSIVKANGQEMFTEEEDKINFINDFIIPLDAAKFVFFDAEKIAEVANLSIKEEGSFINDAFSKVLGLDIYEQLIGDIKNYINNLTRSDLKGNSEEQVIDIEKTLKKLELSIEDTNVKNIEFKNKIIKYKEKISEYNKLINDNGNTDTTIDREALSKEKETLVQEIKNLQTNFQEIGEILPFIILSGKLGEIKEHITHQKENNLNKNSNESNQQKIEQFIESLFNKPPEPDNSSMSLKDKFFYYEKAKDLSRAYFTDDIHQVDLEFEHDLSPSDEQLIDATTHLVDAQSPEKFTNNIKPLNAAFLRQQELDRLLTKIDAEVVDEYISEIVGEKQLAEQKIADFNRSIGKNEEKQLNDRSQIARLSEQYSRLLKKIEVSKENQKKIECAEQYVQVLQQFVNEQKFVKKERLEANILSELKLLMHKLNTDNDFIQNTVVNILPDGHGMQVRLYNSEDDEVKKESLSQGEKQLYISCLIKAILKESKYDLPIFIDTPLGRLDDKHIKNTLSNYYPSLSKQVILLSTNNEITVSRFNEIKSHVAKSYLIKNDGKRSSFVHGYYYGATQ